MSLDDFPRVAYLPNQIAGTLGHLPAQDFIAILRDPYQVIFDVAQRVPAMPVLCRSLILVENRSKLTA